jgi:glycosyltransferase involved in cell wall biosynthesis
MQRSESFQECAATDGEQPTGRPLRVAHLIVGLARAGAETALLRLILDTRGTVQHHVVGMTNESALVSAMEDAGARVTVLGASRRVPNPLLLRNATSALLRDSPDVVHVWMWHAAALWGMCRIDARIRRIPCVWGIRTPLDSGRLSLSTRLALAIARASSAHPRAIMFNSECSRAQHAHAGFCMEHASVTHNGVDVPDELDIGHWRRAIRAQIGVTDEDIVFMHVGRAHPDKGVGNFIQAAEIVHTELGARAVFVRVGKPAWETGQCGTDIALERSSLIYHAGEQLDARPWLSAADVCAMTSVRESCPNVVLEAMSVGTPVVATDVGDAALLVGQCGWVVQPQSPRLLAEAMIAAASCIAEPLRRTRLSATCRMVVTSRHSRDEVARKQVVIYRGAIKP